MATNLVTLVMQFLTPDMIARIASALGLDRVVAQKAITGAVPAILSGLAGVASAPSGARQLANAVSQQGPGMLSSLQNIIGGSGQKAFLDSGTSMLSGLLGSGTTDALTQCIGRFAGMGEAPTKSLLGMLGPVIMGALGEQQRSAGLDTGGLASLLTSQKEELARAIPSGLADRLGAAGLMDSAAGGLRTGAAAASRFGEAAERTATSASQAAYTQAAAAARSTGASQWPIWALGALVLAGLAWYFMPRNETQTVAEAPRPTQQVPAPSETPRPVPDRPSAPQAAQNQPAPATTPSDRVMDTANVALGTPSLMVGGVNLASQVNTSVNGLKSALADVKDTASAQAALPKIKDAIGQLGEVRAQSDRLSPEGKSALAKMITAAMPTINQLCDKALAMPGVGSIAKPTIDELRGTLDALARA